MRGTDDCRYYRENWGGDSCSHSSTECRKSDGNKGCEIVVKQDVIVSFWAEVKVSDRISHDV